MSFNHPIEASVTIDIGEEDKKEKDVLEEEMKEKEKDEISASRYESEKEPTKRRSANRLIHTIRKVKFLAKNSILTKLQHFHEFFTQIFFDNFSREIKVVNS